MDDIQHERKCPECKGQCYDRDGNECLGCWGEGVILTLASYS